MATAADGRFVVAWQSDEQDGDAHGVYAQLFAANGSPSGPEIRINEYTTNDQYFCSVAMDPLGNWVVVWVSMYQDGSGGGIYARCYDAAGVPVYCSR